MNNRRNHIAWGEVFKTLILTAWLGFSSFLMLQVCSIPMTTTDAEFWSKLIAILGILVATLIGWQIYSVMDWNGKSERIYRIEKGYANLLDKVISNRNYAEASVLYLKARNLLNDAYANPDESNENFREVYKFLLKAISLYTTPSVESQIEDCIGWMNAAIQNIERFDLGSDIGFQTECDEIYQSIKENKHHLTVAQQDKLKVLNERRKNLSN